MALPEPKITEEDVHAVRAFLKGEATKAQQLRAARWIGEECCHVFDSPFVAHGVDRETFVMIGRHQIGVLIAAMNNPLTLEKAKASDRAEAETQRRGAAHK